MVIFFLGVFQQIPFDRRPPVECLAALESGSCTRTFASCAETMAFPPTLGSGAAV
jgi:hypothetical protein